MQSISVEEFKNFSNKEQYIFFFTIPGLCGLCSIQEKEYEKFNIPNLIKVQGSISDEEYFMNIGIGALPCTMVFNSNSVPRIKKFGVLYSTQIEKLLKEFKDG